MDRRAVPGEACAIDIGRRDPLARRCGIQPAATRDRRRPRAAGRPGPGRGPETACRPWRSARRRRGRGTRPRRRRRCAGGRPPSAGPRPRRARARSVTTAPGTAQSTSRRCARRLPSRRSRARPPRPAGSGSCRSRWWAVHSPVKPAPTIATSTPTLPGRAGRAVRSSSQVSSHSDGSASSAVPPGDVRRGVCRRVR